MLIVYVLLKGERHEGGSVQGVSLTFAAAKKAAAKLAARSGGAWIAEDVVRPKPGKPLVMVSDSGVDEIRIEAWEVVE